MEFNVWLVSFSWFHTNQLEILRLLVSRFTLYWFWLIFKSLKIDISLSKWPLKVKFVKSKKEEFDHQNFSLLKNTQNFMSNPIVYIWSASWPIKPRDNIKLCPKEDELETKMEKNFIKLNKEAVGKKKFNSRHVKFENHQLSSFCSQ